MALHHAWFFALGPTSRCVAYHSSDRMWSDCSLLAWRRSALYRTDLQIEVLLRVNAFCDAFKGIVSGSSSDKTLAQRNRALYATFAQNIRETSPDFRPFERPTLYSRIALDSGEPWSAPAISMDSSFCVQSTQSSWNGVFGPGEPHYTPVVHQTPARTHRADPISPSPVDEWNV